jgi:uncharacterized membrane protein YfhO
VVEEIKREDDDFYRMEVANSVTLNSPMLYNYPGISQFSSTVNESATNFMASVGIEGGGAKNRFTYAVTDPVTDAILNVKYLVGRGSTIDNETTMELIKTAEDGTSLYKNKYALPVGYMVDPVLIHTWDNQQDNPYHILNDFVKMATDTDDDVFDRISSPEIRSAGVDVSSEKNGFFDCQFRGDTKVGKVELIYTIPGSQQVYAYVDSHEVEYIAAERSDGTELQLPTDVGGVISVGHMNKGDTLKITVEYTKNNAEDIEAYIYGLDEEVWARAYGILNDETLRVTDHNSTMIKGDITVKHDGMCIISVPYEKGWTVKVDGAKREIQLLEECMIALPLTEGEHHIQLKFVPNGLVAGMVLTLAGVIIFAGMCLIRRRKCKEC